MRHSFFRTIIPNALRSLFVLVLVFAFTLSTTRQLHAQGSYVVGPGDSFSIQLYGLLESRQESVPVAADGTLSFLEARRVKVAGLTIAQARKKLETALAVSVRSPRLIMNPVACLLYTSPSPRDKRQSRMPSSA